MKAFVAWALSRRYWVVLLAIGFGQIFPPLTCALFIADAAHNGPRKSMPAAGIAVAAISLLAAASGVFVGMAIVFGAGSVLAGFLIGSLLHTSRSLELAFQATMLTTLIVAGLITALGPSPSAMVAPFVTELSIFMESAGASSAQLDVIEGWDPVLLLGLFFAGATMQVLGSLMLGHWWLGLVDPQVQFGRQFRSLRLGRVVGVASMLILVVGLAAAWPVVRNLTPMTVIGFLFQGLAVTHAWLHAKEWHPILAVAVYVSVITPLSGLTVMALCATGLLDNFFSLRRPIQPGT
jgi:hypothetical protein